MPRSSSSRSAAVPFALAVRLAGPVAVALPASPAHADVVINEIHCAPAEKTVPEEFVELYNRSSAAVDVSGWYFSQGIDFTMPPGTVIPAGGYLVVAQDPATLRARYGEVPVAGPFTGRLDNDGEEIVLRNARGVREDTVDYGRAFPWPTAGGPSGFSLELVHPDLDNDLGGSWRLSNPLAGESNALVPAGDSWRYFKGTSEPSSPRSAWRLPGFSDSSWARGTAPIGYGEALVATALGDMPGGYSTVYLRRTFEVADPAAVGALALDVLFDDGFNAWINGVHVAGSNVPAAEMAHDGTASSAREDLDFNTFSLPRPASYLVAGTNVLAIQLHNASLSGSSDAFLDARLSDSPGAGSGPTPGGPNSVYSTSLPPHLRQVSHAPRQPRPGEPVLVTIKATDPDGVESVTLEYQLVDPGAYIELTDPEYAADWTAVEMNDAGLAGDLWPADAIYSVLLPASLQVHRRLVRYRVTAADRLGHSIRAPYADDPQPNFAYFVYGGAPPWEGAIEPGSLDAARRRVVTYGEEVMNRLPIYHLITKRSAAEDATWFSRYGGSDYRWRGTLVYDGDVYDHIGYRARGGVWRYAMGKNMWKFDFLRGHSFRARDDFGGPYDTSWDKLNFSAVIQQGDYLHRGEQGLFEAVGFKLFNLAGVEAPKTHFVWFRIVDEAEEQGATQYGGDLWGLYLVLEQMDGRFLDEHGLPDGNLYKMEGGSGTLNNQGPTAVTDRSDLNTFMSTYSSTTPPDEWWRRNLDLKRYYSYRSIVEAIHHYDIGAGKNYFYYLNPETDQWIVLPWDIDLTWANNMFGDGNEPFRSRVLPRADFLREYRNRLREIRDLLYNLEQTGQLIDEFAAMIHTPGEPSVAGVDRSLWDYNPIMVDPSIVNLSKAGHGRFYQRAATRDFPGMAQLMKDYVASRGQWIDRNIAADPDIPETPEITSASSPDFAIDRLVFRTSPFRDPQGDGTFGALEWRLAEVTPPGAPAFVPGTPRRWEIQAVWESAEVTVFRNEIQVPPYAAAVGRTYRVRARMMDDTGRWSHWSDPIEFTPSVPAIPFPAQSYLRITEIMYHPPEGEDYEFVEIQNTGPTPVGLAHVAFTGGIDFDFTGSDVTSLGPGELVLVVKDRRAFSAAYDTSVLAIAGEYGGRLANDTDRLVLTYGQNLTVLDFTYLDGWYPETDGDGYSLVHVDPLAPPSTWDLASSWAPSTEAGGSPGRAEGGPPPGGLQQAGDSNQDGYVDLADAVSLLFRLFGGSSLALPCDGEGLAGGGNLAVFDVNWDGQVNLTDPVYLLSYLFRGGPAPVAGTRCVRAEGCPSACRF